MRKAAKGENTNDEKKIYFIFIILFLNLSKNLNKKFFKNSLSLFREQTAKRENTNDEKKIYFTFY